MHILELDNMICLQLAHEIIFFYINNNKVSHSLLVTV